MAMRRLFLEQLEARQMMAGNVTVEVVEGELRISGDGLSNWIHVREVPGTDGSGRTFVVTGRAFNGEFNSLNRPVEGTSATRINGQSTGGQTFFAGKDTVRINMGGGNDAVQIGVADENASFNLLTVHTGDGRDYVGLKRTAMNGTATPLAVNTGGDSQAHDETVDLDRVNVKAQSLIVATGGGEDQIVVRNVQVGETLSLNTGAGNDQINSIGIDAESVSMRTGTGNERDLITLSGLQAITFTVNLGAGNDRLWLKQSISVSDTANLNGSDGEDTILRGETVFLHTPVIVGFENHIIVSA